MHVYLTAVKSSELIYNLTLKKYFNHVSTEEAGREEGGGMKLLFIGIYADY